ncbi:unnamed protein product [Calypogeia fissa]
MSTVDSDENSSDDDFEARFGRSQNRPNIPDGERASLLLSTETMGQAARHWRREKDYRFIPSLVGRTLEEGVFACCWTLSSDCVIFTLPICFDLDTSAQCPSDLCISARDRN